MEIPSPVKAERMFLPAEAAVATWAELEPWYLQLVARKPDDASEVDRWLRDRGELEAAISEEGAWRYIRMTCDTRDEQAAAAYQAYITGVMPEVEKWTDKLDRQLMAMPDLDALPGEGYAVYLRGVRERLRIFREANVPVQAELRALAQEYSSAIGAMSIAWKGEEITLPRAAALLEGTDRAEREAAWRAIAARRARDAAKLDGLFDTMVKKRHGMACEAGFANFRDYSYSALGRFDHTPEDARVFHQAVEQHLVPLVDRLEQERLHSLGVDSLRPWDLAVDMAGRPPLRPFADPDQLVALTEEVFGRLHPYFAGCIRTLRSMGRLDLASRPGKAPGGYNYPLYVTGAPFIFMNAVGTQDDLITMLHEGGHAVHSFLTHPLPVTAFKEFPSEVAELASMGMELLTMAHWDLVYTDPEELRRARRDQLERVLGLLPWVATVDAFQHAIYEQPGATPEQRHALWLEAHQRFGGKVVDHSGLGQERAHLWHKQLHIFEMPFYYIEYGIAQLGAIALWRRYKQDPAAAVEAYISGLKLGYTRDLPTVYAEAGVPFDLSPGHVAELAGFIRGELDAC